MSHELETYRIDARYLAPPEPFVLTMEMLDRLPDGEILTLLLFREPHPLYQVLKKNGYRHETCLLPDGTFEIQISR